jgi:AraC family transcriptional regulator
MKETILDTVTIQNYRNRFQRVLHHIDAHLDDDLSVETLSGVAAFSRFHFHRQFSELLGIGVFPYIQGLRLKRASYRLAFRKEMSILEIALSSRYEGPEAFARAFKQRAGLTPSAFRKEPHWDALHDAHRSIVTARNSIMQQTFAPIEIIDVQETRIAILSHRGDPASIGKAIRRFIDWRKSAGLPPRLNATYNIFHNDPQEVVPEDFRLDLCVATDRNVADAERGITAGVIPAGRCAVLRHTGSDDGLGPALTHLYAHWLPKSGETPRDFPLYCQRIRFFPDVPEQEAVTDIFLPLA